VAVLDALDIPKAQVVAHDWGAMIGWLLAGTYPERFASCIAISVGHPSAYASAAFVDASWRYKRLEGVSHWAPVDVPDRLSALILDFYK
jgi:pimeloyl-ACP methyl ester carboxylesterase